MKHFHFIALASLLLVPTARAVTLSSGGKTRMVIVVDPAATPPEKFAAAQLASNLNLITGATFEIRTNSTAPSHAIIVGQGQAAQRLFHDKPFAQLHDEEWLLRTQGNRILLSGGRPRGTLYAVSRFLQDECGVRWWTPWASTISNQPNLKIPPLNVQGQPAFEYRTPYWNAAFNPTWSWENQGNSQFSDLTPEEGGAIEYKGFVHTFYHLVPPDKYFAPHPEWYSLVKGRRTSNNAQLCTTDPKLREFMLNRVRKELRHAPAAGIISVSQNDCFNPCTCSNCAAIDAAEGSHSGSMLSLVNYIAENIQDEFPKVAVDTLAYQYTRKPPQNLHARSNVIVRLCSIECNFREPLDQPANASFGNDLRSWAQHSDRLYIWDYVTDFGHYLQPHPNWFSLGPNLRFFAANHVRGVFEEGAYESPGAEMAEMRAWVLAQLMVNPNQDDRALIREFLNGYYGAAGRPIWDYLNLLYQASAGYNLTCYSPTDAPFLRFKTLAEAEKLWQQAESAVAGNDELLARVRLGHLPVRYVWLARWKALQKQCARAGAQWPLNSSKDVVADEWLKTAHGLEGKPWTKITAIHEGGGTPEELVAEVKARAD